MGLRSVMASLPQLAVMAAIVATLAYFPLGIVIGGALVLFGVPPQALLTFDGALNTVFGLVAWWLLAFAGACAYAACAFPWETNR